MDIDIFRNRPNVAWQPHGWMRISVFDDRVFGYLLYDLWKSENEYDRPDTTMFRMAAFDHLYTLVLQVFFSEKAGIAPMLGDELDIPIYSLMENTRYGETMGSQHRMLNAAGVNPHVTT